MQGVAGPPGRNGSDGAPGPRGEAGKMVCNNDVAVIISVCVWCLCRETQERMEQLDHLGWLGLLEQM